MKVLLDECVTKRLKPYLQDFDVITVVEMGWSGVKNGKLISLCIANNFDVILTIDKNMTYQQNIEYYPITVAVLDSMSSKLEELILFIPSFSKEVHGFEKSKTYLIKKVMD